MRGPSKSRCLRSGSSCTTDRIPRESSGVMNRTSRKTTSVPASKRCRQVRSLSWVSALGRRDSGRERRVTSRV